MKESEGDRVPLIVGGVGEHVRVLLGLSVPENQSETDGETVGAEGVKLSEHEGERDSGLKEGVHERRQLRVGVPVGLGDRVSLHADGLLVVLSEETVAKDGESEGGVAVGVREWVQDGVELVEKLMDPVRVSVGEGAVRLGVGLRLGEGR